MLKPFYLFLLLILFSIGSTAQGYITGYLKDSITHFPIRDGTIKNSTAQQSVQTDEKGFFRLKAAPNDLIYILATAYHYDTLRYSPLFSDTVVLFLSPSGNFLPNVSVTANYTKYQLDSANRRAAFIDNRGTVVKAISGTNSGAFGVGINLDRFFKKKYRDKKDYERMYKRTEEQAYIDYRFSPQLVASITRLKDEQLKAFLYQYTPSYQWLRQHPTNDDVLYYINDRLKQFRASLPK
ncbi:MAG TPA: hypothetical protein VM888_10770 [Chitinophagaceae bacterium]|jgi:hypothetical protein|nr:hypothetical protein [Chitinophagaceae bacterium]